MKVTNEIDVLIVGAGLVGLTLVNALRGSRLSVRLIDAQNEPKLAKTRPVSRQGAALIAGVSPRVSAINLASEVLLNRLGAWPKEGARQCMYRQMSVWDSQGTASIQFDASLTAADHLGTIIENDQLIQALLERAKDVEEAQMTFGCSVEAIQRTATGYQVRLPSGEEICCRLLVGADGGASIVRELTAVRTVEWSYQQAALVTTIETQLPHEGVARQCFTPIGALAFLPLANPNYCSVVWSSASTADLLALDDVQLCRRLTQGSESILGEVVAVDQRFSFPLRQRHALRYVQSGLALIGDAAHSIHPLAGQGANLGFADAQALAMVLQQCRFSGQSCGDLAVLRRYEQARRPANLAMTAVMEGLKRIFDTSDPGVNWLRNLGLSLLNRQTRLKAMVAKLAAGV